MSSNGNGKPWGTIKEVEVANMPTRRNNHWQELYKEIRFRLEQTPRAFALAIEFDKHSEAKKAYSNVSRFFNRRRGKGYIEASIRKSENGGGVLYVRQGPNYSK